MIGHLQVEVILAFCYLQTLKGKPYDIQEDILSEGSILGLNLTKYQTPLCQSAKMLDTTFPIMQPSICFC